MKNLNKLQINSGKLIKDAELKIISGGYGTCYGCYDGDGHLLGTFYGTGLTESEALAGCSSFYSGAVYAIQGTCA